MPPSVGQFAQLVAKIGSTSPVGGRGRHAGRWRARVGAAGSEFAGAGGTDGGEQEEIALHGEPRMPHETVPGTDAAQATADGTSSATGRALAASRRYVPGISAS